MITETDRLETEYRAEFQSWNWQDLKSQCIQSAIETWQEAEADPEWRRALEMDGIIEKDQVIGSAYVGNMIWPSSKYYMPWATGGLVDCPYCAGSGHSPETQTCHICNGQGYRSLAELAKLRHETVQKTKVALANYREVIGEAYFRCNYCHGATVVKVDCEYCGGHGCQEAYQDMVWNDCLETEAGRHHMWSGSGEGDPTDLFVFCWVDMAQINLVQTVQAFLKRTVGYKELKQAVRPLVW
jgi:hypothetical protein